MKFISNKEFYFWEKLRNSIFSQNFRNFVGFCLCITINIALDYHFSFRFENWVLIIRRINHTISVQRYYNNMLFNICAIITFERYYWYDSNWRERNFNIINYLAQILHHITSLIKKRTLLPGNLEHRHFPNHYSYFYYKTNREMINEAILNNAQFNFINEQSTRVFCNKNYIISRFCRY